MGEPSDAAETTAFPLDDFRGGMRMDMDPSKLGPGEYFFLSNGRNRKGVITPVKLPKSYLDLPGGNYQGIYGAGSFILCFIDGKAYFQDFSKPQYNFFSPIGKDFQLDKSVDTIYVALVPASTVNFQRQHTGTQGATNPPTNPVTLTTSISGSPVCAICQDGINQSRLIFPDGSTRLSQTFAQWTLDGSNNGIREYVPVGKQMLYPGDGKLYMASPDGRELYHSVTGRPLDFVIAIDQDFGNKLNDGLFDVEASRLSHKIDYDPISCLGQFNLDNADPGTPAGIFVSTNKVCYKVTPDYGNPLFGEPTFRNSFLFSSGALNQFSYIADLLGDSMFIDGKDIRSFNAVQHFKFEGNNSMFNQSVYPLFTGINQVIACSTTFENYAVFAVNTVFGYGVLVFDSLLQKFISLDIYPGIGPIKQFAPIKVNSVWRLFFITSSGLYEAFAGSKTATAKFYPKELVFPQPDTEHCLQRVRYVMQNSYEAGTLTMSDYCDRAKGSTISTPIDQKLTGTPSQEIPFGDSSVDSVDDDVIPFTESNVGHKVGVMISWDCLAELRSVIIVTDPVEGMLSQTAAAKAYAPENVPKKPITIVSDTTPLISAPSVGSIWGDPGSGSAWGSSSEGSGIG